MGLNLHRLLPAAARSKRTAIRGWGSEGRLDANESNRKGGERSSELNHFVGLGGGGVESKGDKRK